jgi:hypothetical protein
MAGPRLIDLQTDLKSLRYGSDKPYVTKDINNPPSSNQTGMQITKRVDDLTRIGKMLIDRPGLKFLGNQALLQQVNVQDKIQKAKDKGKTTVGAILQQGLATVKQTAKILGSTIAQVPVNGTGTHFVYAFRTDTYLQPAGGNQRSAFAQFFGAGGIEGAQYALRGEEVPLGEASTNLLIDGREDSKYSYGVEIRADYNEVENYKQPENSQLDREPKTQAEQGIPINVSPVNGPRNTTLYSSESDGISNASDSLNPNSFVHANDDTKYEQQSGERLDYDPENPIGSTYTVQKRNYITKNNNITKEQRVRLGDQGAKGTPDMQLARRSNSYWFRSDPKPENALEVDKINALFPNDGKLTVNGSTVEGGQTLGRDLIKFRFHILTADGKEKVLYFRAFLDAFADNYTGQWSQVKYLGRAEDFQIYSGFQRKITLSFKIAAASRAEMRPLYEKMIWLASATAPTYASGGQFMRGTITKITVGDYIYELPGVLNSVGYTWNPEYPWEIAMTQPENLGIDDFEQELPQVMDCQIDFTPIHTFTPTTGLKEYITTKTSEGGRNGIPDIDNQKTGIEPVPEVPATQAAAFPKPQNRQSLMSLDGLDSTFEV